MYKCYTNIVQGITNGTIGKTFGTNGNANGTTGSPNGTIGTIGKPMVPLATNGAIGKITNGTIRKPRIEPLVLYIARGQGQTAQTVFQLLI